jgi:hypothetical protein
MILFKKYVNRKSSTADNTPIEVLKKWNIAKRKLAIFLQRKSELLSLSAKKYSLIFFCALFGGSSIAIIIRSVASEKKTVRVTNISKPGHTRQDEITSLELDSVITRREYERMIQLKNYLLQLKSDSASRKQYDSITLLRPHLMDTIILFEKMYLSQK